MKKTLKANEIIVRDEKVCSKFSRVPYYPLVIKKGYGSTIVDVDGNKYIDLLSSAAALNTGHCHPKIVKAIKSQLENFIHYTPAYMYNEAVVELADELIKITPGNFKKKVTFGLTGSDANDGMIKLTRAYTGRTKIVTFIGSYHGSTYGAISMSAISLNMRRKIGPLLPEIEHIPYPDCYRCKYEKKEQSCNLECLQDFKMAMETYMPAESIAAVVMEPIAGDAGIIVPPIIYVKEMYSLCQKNGILFVSEEVQQGFGRTGKWFGIEHFDVIPDIVIMGKAMASGLPLSGIVAREEIMNSLNAPAHLFTMGGNPVCCKASLATIQVIRDDGLLQNSRNLGKYAIDRFLKLQDKYAIIGDVRGLGLSIGVELVKDAKTKEKHFEAAAKICYRCWEKGVILIFFAKSVLRFQPPLVITKQELDDAFEVIESSIVEYLNGEISDEIFNQLQGW
jgi:4-aminobutyrate aminotransferase